MSKEVNMTGSSKKRKLSSKGKTFVRRVIAGLFMITALIIAAIPEDSSGTASAHTTDDPLDYTADALEDRNGDLVGRDQSGHAISFLTTPSSDDLYYSYQILDVGGNIQLLWKYQYYSAIMDGSTAGVISDYNDTMSIAKLDLNNNIISGYEYVTQDEYNNFVTNTVNNIKWTIDIRPGYNGSDGSDYLLVNKYFPEKYEQFVTEYNQALDTYRKNNAGTVAADWYPQNRAQFDLLQIAPLVVQGEDMTDAMRRIYYCDTHKNRGSKTISLTGCTLEQVNNLCISNPSSGTVFKAYNGIDYDEFPSDAQIYIVKKYDSTATGDNYDANGYMYNGSTTIKAISNGAFYNTKLVDELAIGSGINYVGDEAFKDSFIKSVNFVSVTYIGNRVFMDCDSLSTVDLGSYTTTLGREAFYGCDALTDIHIPKDVSEIGFGAFAECPILSTADFSANQGCNIGEYAFYDCPNLSSVVFPDSYSMSLGKACFAMGDGLGTGCAMTQFNFPSKLGQYMSGANGDYPETYTYDGSSTYTSKFGDYLLANRYNLRYVYMPSDFGSSSTVESIPVRTFDNCPDVETLFFGNSVNTNAEFEPELFEDVTNPNLYVYGPQSTSIRGSDGEYYAYPRRSTWKAFSAVNQYVPYVYNDGTTDHYEVGVGDFRYELSVDNSNMTASMLRCEFIDPSSAAVGPLTVPGDVAGYSIKSMNEGCFDTVKDYIDVLTIADNSIESIGDGVFSECDNLERVILGNSVANLGTESFSSNPNLEWVEIGENIQSVGDKAFYNCPKLYTVDWDTPSSYQTLTNIGADAFYTGNPDGLIFYSDIVNGYLPFDYAMGNNKINTASMRICVQQTIPSNYTDCIFGTGATPTPSPVLETYRVVYDEADNCPILIDYPRYSDLDSSIRTKYQSGSALNDLETMQVSATQFITLPSAVESVEIASFLSSDTSNPNKKDWAYVPATPIDESGNLNKIDVYSDKHVRNAENKDCTDYYESLGLTYTPGLFSGEMSDATELNALIGNSDDETRVKGNDWIVSVEMPGVKRIPDFCFDSCERLQSVIISDSCSEIGESAFIDCTSLSGIGTNNNPYYAFDNFILYKKNPDGTYTLTTCLPARGVDRTSTQIWLDANNDPLLADTSAIKDGAFANCKYITKADLSDTTLKTIPKRCFYGCENLTEAELPDTIASVGKASFDTGSPTLDITVPSNANISENAFDKDCTVTIRTYPSCENVVNYQADDGYTKIYIKLIDADFYITYLNDDLTVYERIQVPQGYRGSIPLTNPVPLLPEHKGYKFSYWYYDHPLGIVDVNENRQAIAVFVANSPSQNSPSQNTPSQNRPSGNNNNNHNNNNNSSSANKTTYTVTVENGSGSGKYEPGKVVTITAYAPTDAKVFDKWTTSNSDIAFVNPNSVSTTFIMPTHDVKVTATYKTAVSNNQATPTPTPSPSSGDSNNSGGNSGNNGNNGNSGSSNNNGQGGTEVRVTTDAIDNNNKNLASATVAGSTDNFVVKITDSAAAQAQVEAALKARYGNDLSAIKYVAFDISLYDETGTYPIENSDNLAVTITLPIPDDLVAYAGNNKAAVVINGQLDDKDVRFTTIDGVPCMTFTATHFSPYTIYVDTNNLVSGVNDATPKTGVIPPKWFLAGGLGCISIIMFVWRDKKKIQLT